MLLFICIEPSKSHHDFMDYLNGAVCSFIFEVSVLNYFLFQVFVGVAFIIACIASAKMAKTGHAGRAASFCAVWTALLLIAISIAGSLIMRRVSTILIPQNLVFY